MSLESFFHEEDKPTKWGSPVEKQTHLRIKLSIAAYAYEIENSEIMSDAEFDKKCLEVDTSIDTGNEVMDRFFREQFDSSTGQWIHRHPELNEVKQTYNKYYKLKRNT
jgi:hypothetical protein